MIVGAALKLPARNGASGSVARVIRPLLSKVRMKSPKKNSLLRMMGPPSANPPWKYVVSGGSGNVEKKLRATVASVLPNAKTEPLYSFVPDFSVTFVTAPPARPNSAS